MALVNAKEMLNKAREGKIRCWSIQHKQLRMDKSYIINCSRK